MGVAQLEQLPEYIRIKKCNFEEYRRRLADIPGLRLADVPAYADNNHWMYAMRIDRDAYGADSETLMARLAAEKIQTRLVWHLNHLQRPYQSCQHYRIERAPKLLDCTLNIPCSVGLKPEELDRVVRALQQKP